MSIIFFDLETSDREPCGQILNYSFIRTNDAFEIEDELNGDIDLSILQIPTPGALLTNRVRILDHQLEKFPTEPEAMRSIAEFISESIANSKSQVYLAGYNSTNFDLRYLRTSLIRNGINPYFGGNIKYRDVFHLVKKAYLSNPNFPAPKNTKEPEKLSLSLEACCHALGLLSGIQTHHSRDDVLLTIELSKRLKQDYSVDVIEYLAYEPIANESLIIAASPNYEAQEPRARFRHYGLLNGNHRSALWIDLDRYVAGEGRDSISWTNKNAGQLIVSREQNFPPELAEILPQAKQKFASLTPDNFFTKSSCDIEQDIYRLDMQKISTLGQIIWENDRSLIESIKDKDLQNLVSRYWLAYGLTANKRGPKWQEKLKAYAKYRYAGNEFQLTKTLIEAKEDGEDVENFHPSLSDIKKDLAEYQSERTDPEDQEILRQLQVYIDNSAVGRCF